MNSDRKPFIYSPGEFYQQVLIQLPSLLIQSTPVLEMAGFQIEGDQGQQPDGLTDHWLFFDMSAGRAGALLNDGRVQQHFFCQLKVLVRETEADADQQAMDIASRLASLVYTCNWGWLTGTVALPEHLRFCRLQQPEDNAQLRGFACWQLHWKQALNLGERQYPAEEPVNDIWLAVNPENPDDPAYYQEVTAQCLNNLITE